MVRGVAVGLAAAVAVLGLVVPGAARSATTFDRAGAVRFGGRPVFPIALSGSPPLGSKTPWGTDALSETASAGIDVYSVGPGTTWTSADIVSALAWDSAAAANHVHTWVNLSGYASATPGSNSDVGLAGVVGALTSDPSGSAVAFWKGRDEPWWSSFLPSQLQFAYCRVTSRGDPSWCGGEPALGPEPLWVTIQAPRGTAADLAPYSSVTDVHGVDVFPVTLAQPFPSLHRVGKWTATIASITPQAPIWTTLQICASGSFDKTTGDFVLPTYQQERYMAYDAILNGASAIAFRGGNIPGCWNATDSQYGWNWTFWQGVLEPLVRQLSASSSIAPALVNAARTPHVTTAGSGTQTLVRQGTSADDLWLIAAHNGAGARVTFKGLPRWVRRGAVYTENRSIVASAGSFRDRFAQWDVHVYHFVEPLILQKVSARKATVGSRVTLQGRGLAAATTVTFGGARAHFKKISDRTLVATVPKKAQSGPIVVASPLRTVQFRARFTIVPTVATVPRITGAARVGERLTATTGVWYGDPPLRYRFRWLACNRRGLDCRAVRDATGNTLQVRRKEIGDRLRVLVTVYTDAGSARARSAASAVVTE